MTPCTWQAAGCLIAGISIGAAVVIVHRQIVAKSIRDAIKRDRIHPPED